MKLKRIILLLLTVMFSFSYGEVFAKDGNSLKKALKNKFLIGVSVNTHQSSGKDVAAVEIVKKNFNSIVAENCMKSSVIHPKENKYNFAQADEFVSFGESNQMAIIGHCLIWHSQLAPWFCVDKDGNNVSPEVLKKRMKDHITTIVKRYKGRIKGWDVVNEAADENQYDGLRRSYWYQIIGPDYLYYAFLYAREAETLYAKQYASLYGLDADTDDLSSIQPKLFYNDYNEWFGSRSDAIIHFLTEEPWNENHEKVKSSVINPDGDGTIYGDGLLDGIGMQGHLDDTQNIEQYMIALEKYNAAVPELHITELDIGRTGTDANANYYQAKFYYEFFSRLIEEVKKGVIFFFKQKTAYEI